ncbi:MAG: nitroreductase family protein [Campylobacter sp.]|nr:nitroreductase family protein [Campylobacter sp.]
MKSEVIKHIMNSRYSCREFNSKEISDELLRDIIDQTRLSPSSLGLEPWKFMIVRGEFLKELGEICYNQSHVANCSVAIVVIARDDLRSGDEFLRHVIFAKNKGEQMAESFLQRVGHKTDAMSDKEMAAYTNMQCYLATANLVNIAFANDVKSCIIGGFNYEKLKDFISLDDKFRPCLVVALGYSDAPSKPKLRLGLDEILLYKK